MNNRPKKTTPVRPVLERLNLLIDKAATQEARIVLCELAEYILFESNNYHGFSYVGGYHPESPDFDDYHRKYTVRVGP